MNDQAIRVERHGGAEQLVWTRQPPSPPGPGEVLLDQQAARVVEAVGPGVSDQKPGDRVGNWTGAPSDTENGLRALRVRKAILASCCADYPIPEMARFGT